MLLAIYYVWDRFWYYPRENGPRHRARRDARRTACGSPACGPTPLLLVGVILSVALLDPGKPFPGTDWHPWLYLREIVQLALVGLSLALGSAARSAERTVSTTARSSKWPRCSSASSSACSRRCRSCASRGAILGLTTPGPLLLGHGQPVLGARQRPDLRRLLRDGQVADRAADWRRPMAGVAETAADRPSAWARSSWAR